MSGWQTEEELCRCPCGGGLELVEQQERNYRLYRHGNEWLDADDARDVKTISSTIACSSCKRTWPTIDDAQSAIEAETGANDRCRSCGRTPCARSCTGA